MSAFDIDTQNYPHYSRDFWQPLIRILNLHAVVYDRCSDSSHPTPNPTSIILLRCMPSFLSLSLSLSYWGVPGRGVGFCRVVGSLLKNYGNPILKIIFMFSNPELFENRPYTLHPSPHDSNAFPNPLHVTATDNTARAQERTCACLGL